MTRAGHWAPQSGGWYLWRSTLTKCENVAQQSVKTTREGQLCRHHGQWREEEVLQAAGPAAPEKPHIEADTNLATPERPHGRAARDALKESAAHWEPILLYFQLAINQINFPQVDLFAHDGNCWVISQSLPWAVPSLLSKLILLRKQSESSLVGMWRGQPRPTHTIFHEDLKINRPYSE